MATKTAKILAFWFVMRRTRYSTAAINREGEEHDGEGIKKVRRVTCPRRIVH
jgi:hypothetical protein